MVIGGIEEIGKGVIIFVILISGSEDGLLYALGILKF